jgi:hypothetical protein
MKHRHTVVWIDHQQARVFHLEDLSSETLRAPHHVSRHETKDRDKEHPNDALHFYRDVGDALADSEAILILGPAGAKLELQRHLQKHAANVESRVVGIESSDHPTDGQVLAHARKVFRAADRMR